jgi:hypothetical protein
MGSVEGPSNFSMMDCSFSWVNGTLVEISKIPHGHGLVYYVVEAGFIASLVRNGKTKKERKND